MGKGRPPTAAEKIWMAARDDLQPQKSLDRVDTVAQFLLGATGVFTTILTGLGFVKDRELPPDPRFWIWIPAIFITISFTAAVIAITPRFEAVRVNDLDAVAEMFQSRIRRGGLLIGISGGAFALAIVSSLIVAMSLPSAAEPAPPIKVTALPSLQLSGEAKRTLIVTVSLAGLPERSKVVSEVKGSLAGGAPKVVFRHIAEATAEGSVTANATIAELTFDKYVLDVRATRGNDVEIYHEVFLIDAAER